MNNLTVAYLQAICSLSGVIATGVLSLTCTIIVVSQLPGMIRRIKDRAPLRKAEVAGWLIIPLWKASILLFWFGCTHYGQQ